MIGRIQGQVLEVTESQILVEVGGLAYEVEISASALQRLPGEVTPGNGVRLYTHFLVREDAQLLYGFASRLERDVFRDLIRISGVGPKLAQNLIASFSLPELARAVQRNDVAMLTRVPGVGRKTAERLLVELKDRLENFVLTEVALPGAPREAAGEAEDALVALGYRPHEAQRAVAEALKGSGAGAGAEELIRFALKKMAQQSEVAP